MITTDFLPKLFSEKKRYIDYFFSNINFSAAQQILELLYGCQGTVFVTGVGKSGIIAKKIAATLVSTGTSARFLSPVEAIHGDLGAVRSSDVMLVLSKSGESDELASLLPYARNKGAHLVAVVCNLESRIAKGCHLAIELPLEKELCPFGLSPTTSATLQLIFGDILTVALMQKKGFTVEEYGENHPAGSIGKKITMKVSDLMLSGDDIPTCFPDATLRMCLPELSQKRCGCLLVVDQHSCLVGIFTDGDLRRALESQPDGALDAKISQLMTKNPRKVYPELLAWDALQLMEENQQHPITVLPVVNHNHVVMGLIRLHDILQSGLPITSH